jgi:hypothetical protein
MNLDVTRLFYLTRLPGFRKQPVALAKDCASAGSAAFALAAKEIE